jgi:hypothetical protein
MPAYDAELFDPPAPLARVGLRHSDTRALIAEVPMLLDWGADVTLVPQTSVIALGASANPGVGYELVGFDGSQSIAQAVQIDLLFLKRVFKGRFLLINQDWGILGATFSIT